MGVSDLILSHFCSLWATFSSYQPCSEAIIEKYLYFFFQFSEVFQGKICQILTYFLLANAQMGFRGSKLSFCSKKPFFCPKSGCIGFRDPSIMRSAQIHMKRLPNFFSSISDDFVFLQTEEIFTGARDMIF